jgi:hypothetical protein
MGKPDQKFRPGFLNIFYGRKNFWQIFIAKIFIFLLKTEKKF